ncbi:hypothetical protein SAMN05216389_101206 [Oceanobacillus limi]|uniref:Uncharacterized protein n=1 Tax=Oceanobacillus limi TaxID=930131 RepID=A0A1H9Y5E9_9BACI|nr:hypothetical protein [Oceanobacillus limi]SES64114.1 hypothetical protein SAMN05216389_101206 [Oceanobacillus limi]
MGFYYFILLFLGIILVLRSVLSGFLTNGFKSKKNIILGVIGILLIGLSIFLFSPGSSEIIADLLQMNE